MLDAYYCIMLLIAYAPEHFDLDELVYYWELRENFPIKEDRREFLRGGNDDEIGLEVTGTTSLADWGPNVHVEEGPDGHQYVVTPSGSLLRLVEREAEPGDAEAKGGEGENKAANPSDGHSAVEVEKVDEKVDGSDAGKGVSDVPVEEAEEVDWFEARARDNAAAEEARRKMPTYTLRVVLLDFYRHRDQSWWTIDEVDKEFFALVARVRRQKDVAIQENVIVNTTQSTTTTTTTSTPNSPNTGDDLSQFLEMVFEDHKLALEYLAIYAQQLEVPDAILQASTDEELAAEERMLIEIAYQCR
jgi:hypothetical protein